MGTETQERYKEIVLDPNYNKVFKKFDCEKIPDELKFIETKSKLGETTVNGNNFYNSSNNSTASISRNNKIKVYNNKNPANNNIGSLGKQRNNSIGNLLGNRKPIIPEINNININRPIIKQMSAINIIAKNHNELSVHKEREKDKDNEKTEEKKKELDIKEEDNNFKFSNELKFNIDTKRETKIIFNKKDEENNNILLNKKKLKQKLFLIKKRKKIIIFYLIRKNLQLLMKRKK